MQKIAYGIAGLAAAGLLVLALIGSVVYFIILGGAHVGNAVTVGGGALLAGGEPPEAAPSKAATAEESRVEVFVRDGGFRAGTRLPTADAGLPWAEFDTRPAGAFVVTKGALAIVFEWTWNGTAPEGLLLSATEPGGMEHRFEGGVSPPQRAEVRGPTQGSWYPQAHPRGTSSDVTYTVYASVFSGSQPPPGYSALPRSR